MENETKRTDKRVERSRSAIVNAYVRLLLKHKYEDISVTDIIRESDYSRTAFYNNFTCKEDLHEYIVKYVGDELLDALIKNSWTESLGNSQYTEQELELSLQNLTAAYETVYEHSDIYRALYKGHGITGLEDVLNYMLDRQHNETHIDITEKKDVSSQLWKDAHLWEIMGHIVWWIQSDFSYSPEYIAKQYQKRWISD